MASYHDQLLRLWERYESETGADTNDPNQFYEWLTKNRLWSPRPQSIRRQLKQDLGEALRHAVRTDENGITYRAKQCIRIIDEDGQVSFRWFDADTASYNNMSKASYQRRKSIVDDVYRWKCDIDHFNSRQPVTKQIQLVFDFTDDIAELEAAQKEAHKKVA